MTVEDKEVATQVHLLDVPFRAAMMHDHEKFDAIIEESNLKSQNDLKNIEEFLRKYILNDEPISDIDRDRVLSGEKIYSYIPLIMGQMLSRDKPELSKVAFDLAVSLGNPDALYELAVQLMERGGEEDLVKSKEYFFRSALQGNAAACYSIGSMRLTRDIDDITHEEAWRLIETAALKNYIPAIHFLSNVYFSGGYGMEEDEERAKFWHDRLK